MKRIILSDLTMKQSVTKGDFSLSFREKIELGKMLDKLGVDVIETGRPENLKTDGLLIKSLAQAVENACISVTVPADISDIDYIWECLKEAKKPRFQVSLPVSTVQMEYGFHKKAEGMLSLIKESVAACKKYCAQVEFCAEDATRADKDFLIEAVNAAAKEGAEVVTLCDTAGVFLPEQLGAFVKEIKEKTDGVKLGVFVSDNLYMAQSAAVNAVISGADEIKVAACGEGTASLEKTAAAISATAETVNAETGIRVTELHRTAVSIERLCKTERPKSSPFDNGVREEEDFFLNIHDDKERVAAAAQKLGYDLTDEDVTAVYEAFLTVADKKEQISAKELDLLIATSALQVPPTYKLESYVINSGNIITSTSQIRLSKDGKILDGVAAGDGPVDSSFLAIEQITGTHYELDDFQIRAVTEGREAMGESVVRLRYNGKLYSGRGLSTNVVGSSIMAYINALNKIVYEEKQE